MIVLTYILAVLDIFICLALVVLVIFQEGNTRGLGVIGGGADTFYGRNKGRTINEKLKKFTSVLAIAFAVVSVALYILLGRGA